ncbi:MAG: hypothetical protein ACRBBW_18200 [Cellvibrionaceae bacterium]
MFSIYSFARTSRSYGDRANRYLAKAFTASLLCSFFTVLTCQATADAQTMANHHGSHGMLIFGDGDVLFASHLPMYHRPHNVQVILRFRFSNLTIDRAVRSSLALTDEKSAAIWTLLPEVFDLMRLDPAHESTVKSLRVDVTEGHFERGGERRFTGVDIVVEEVLVFRPLETEQRRSAAGAPLRYCAFSSPSPNGNQYLVKQLGLRPEADHVVKVTGLQSLNNGCIDVHGDTASTLYASEKLLLEALSDDSLLLVPLPQDLSAVRLRTLYLEEKELE